MWREFFPNAKIYGADIKPVEVPGVDCFQLDQGSQSELAELVGKTGGKFDIIIDDGGHTMTQQKNTFLQLFGHLEDGGIYFLEDIHTSYMPHFCDSEPTTVGFLKACANYVILRGSHLCDEGGFGADDCHWSFCSCQFEDIPFSLLRDVVSIQFYSRIAIITKKIGGFIPGCEKPARTTHS